MHSEMNNFNLIFQYIHIYFRIISYIWSRINWINSKGMVIKMKKIALLGSTGSIGQQSLSVCRFLRIPVSAIVAKSNVKLLAEQAKEFRPRLVGICDKSLYKDLKTALEGLDTEIIAGEEAAIEAASCGDAEIVINAIVGIAGLRPALAAIEAKKTLALANKESLVAGGLLVTSAAKRHGVPVIPVDSEHSAIFQSMRAGSREDVRNVILTASGGPFFGKTTGELRTVKVGDALKHPNWSMGKKITVDSATLMNKGLELIEAMWFFNLSPEQVEIVVHRQSVLHSAVEFVDGSIIAQLGPLDMRGAIQYAITYPRHLPRGDNNRISLTDIAKLTFEKPDYETFKCLSVCIEAAKMGGLAPCTVNGANEQAVELFLDGKIGFLQIGELVEAALDAVRPRSYFTIEDVENADMSAREYVMKNYAFKGSVTTVRGQKPY